MPPEKEARFFNLDERYKKGWEGFARRYFRGGKEHQLWGKATPQYMLDRAVPQRLYETFPDVRLIAILREAVERAYSHWKMHVRLGMETRSFEEAVRQQIRADPVRTLENFRLSLDNATDSYVMAGLYGRILHSWLSYFPRRRLLVLFREDLRRDPLSALQHIWGFLEVSPGFVPANLGKQYYVGGTERRLRSAEHLKDIVPRAVWVCLPRAFRRRAKFWFDLWNVRPSPATDGHAELSSEVARQLGELYKQDRELLVRVIGQSPPWKDEEGGNKEETRRGQRPVSPEEG